MPNNVLISGSLIEGQRYLMRSNRANHDLNEYLAEYLYTNPLAGQQFFHLINNRPIGTLVWNHFNYNHYCLNEYYNIYDLDNPQCRKLTGFTKFLKDKGL